MFLDINYFNLAYTCIFLVAFVVSYFVILATNLEKLFKQGSVWQIRICQFIIALLVAFGIASAIMSLVNATQFV